MTKTLNTDMIESMRIALSSLEQRARELSACLTAMTLVGSTLDLNDVLNRAINCAKEVMNAEAASVMLIDPSTGGLFFKQASGAACDKIKEVRIPKGHGIAGWVAENGEPAVVEDARKDPRFFRNADDKTGFITKSILAVPLKVRDRIIGVAEVINKQDGNFSESDLPLFSAYASLAAVAIENAKMHHQLLEQELLSRELDISRQIQDALQGPEYASLGLTRFNAVSIPARSVGGDFYDWVELGDGRVLITIGDVSGKGIPAALLMSNTISRFRAEAARLVEPNEILSMLNSVLAKESHRGLFVTLFTMLLEPDGHLHYSNAGHQTPLYLSKNGYVELSKAGGPPLGIVPEFKYEQAYTTLFEGDTVVVYTDGVTEAVNPKGEFYGFERLKEKISALQEEAETISQRIREDVENFESGRERTDDLTVVVVHRTHSAETLVKKYERLSPDDLAENRATLDAYLIGLDVEEKVRSSIVLAVDEALTNVIRHAYKGNGGPAEVKYSATRNQLLIEIRDSGCGDVPQIPIEERTEIKPGGLGLVILKKVMDEVSFNSIENGGCLLKMKKTLEHNRETS